MELTKQHFDKQIGKLATKDDLLALRTEIGGDIDNAVEELARITKAGFDDVLERLDVTERVYTLEKDMKKIKDAIHIK